MPWNNNSLVLYHGTDSAAAQSIMSQGVDLKLCSVFTDFGRGFYATTHLAQAWSWAAKRSQLNGLTPAVLQFEIDRERIGLETNLFFSHEDDARTGFFSLVDHCRLSGRPHIPGTSRNYSVVSGPVSLWPQNFTIKDCDQVSFHSKDPAKFKVPPMVDASLAKGTIVKSYAAASGADSHQTKDMVGFMNRLVASTEQALELLGREDSPRLVKRLRDLDPSDLTLHFDPRQLACLLAGLAPPTGRQLERLSRMPIGRSQAAHRPSRGAHGTRTRRKLPRLDEGMDAGPNW